MAFHTIAQGQPTRRRPRGATLGNCRHIFVGRAETIKFRYRVAEAESRAAPLHLARHLANRPTHPATATSISNIVLGSGTAILEVEAPAGIISTGTHQRLVIARSRIAPPPPASTR